MQDRHQHGGTEVWGCSRLAHRRPGCERSYPQVAQDAERGAERLIFDRSSLEML